MPKINLNVTYDAQTDAMYIYLKNDIKKGEVVDTFTIDNLDLENDINLDFDASGHLLGIEILYASTHINTFVLEQIKE